MSNKISLLLLLITSTIIHAQKDGLICDAKVQVLGSGGPELTVNRASSSYLIWINGKAEVMIDAGGGSALRFGQSKADWKDLKAVLFTHFHADHSSDFPALVKASWFGDRDKDLPVFGPYGNTVMPSTKEFFQGLFNDNSGAFKYLSDMVDKNQISDYKLIPNNISDKEQTQLIYSKEGLAIYAHKVKHGPIPAFSYVIEACGKTIVFSGDTNGEGFENLQLVNTDIFIAHNAVPELAGTIAKSLHMTPSKIGETAKHINTHKLILSHRMNRTLGSESQTIQNIKKHFKGDVEFSNDLNYY